MTSFVIGLAQKHRIPKIQFAKHKKIKKRKDQWVDASFLLRIGKKIPIKELQRQSLELKLPHLGIHPIIS